MDSFSSFAFSSLRMEKPSLSSTPSRALPSSYTSPRTIYSDRFIPSRIGSNFTLFDLSPSPSASSSSDVSGRVWIRRLRRPTEMLSLGRISAWRPGHARPIGGGSREEVFLRRFLDVVFFGFLDPR
ncbi:unnamed protein product [Musa acuminata subsp. burmannicoides]